MITQFNEQLVGLLEFRSSTGGMYLVGIDLVGIDLVGIDLVGIDLVGMW